MASITTIGPPPFKDDYATFAREIHFAKIYRSEHDGYLPHDKFWDYSRERRDIDPARFDHYHPTIGHMLKLESEIKPITPTVPMPPLIIEIPGTPETPLLPFVPGTPEPASIIMFSLGMIGIIIYARFANARAKRRRQQNYPDVQGRPGASVA